jgi:hypothetical protein
LPEWPEFARSADGVLYDQLQSLWRGEQEGLVGANEAQTEERWVRPVLSALGFAYTVQAPLRVGRAWRQPDYGLFLSDADRRAALPLEGTERFARAACVADAKRFDRPLDRRRAEGALSEDPVAQIITYISATRCPWGILTNGRHWRLYAAERDLLGGAHYEVDLIRLLEAGDEHLFRWFARFFSASGFRAGAEGHSLLERILAESRAGAVAVGAAIERQVFAAVPSASEGLLGEEPRTPTTLSEAFDNALVLLYRLLFCLHAEARGLLPVENPHYLEYSLRRQKERLAADLERGRRFSRRSDDLYNDLRALFRIVDEGDDALGVAEYDGGLFSARRHPWFEGRSVPDDLLAPALDALYRVGGEFVDYGDLSARHLGTIYERLLDYRLEERDGALALASTSGRRETGSYFTPERIVDRIVERALGPLLDERSDHVAALGLRGEDALEVFLGVRVLDPAMGSGHFLVAAAAWIATHIATDPSYDGELPLVEIQRRVAERCLYGVDLNPMAVELAQLSLWLTTVRRGEPLTFLTNLRVGNALVGVELEELLAGGESLFAEQLARDAEAILSRIEGIAQEGSERPEEVHRKEELALAVESLRGPLERHADEAVLPAFPDEAACPFHWALEFPEVFLSAEGRPRDDGGFDAVIGNPPYVRIQASGRRLADWCRGRYRTASGSFDTYVPFLERGVELLAPRGRLGFIVPNKLMKLDYGRRLRDWLARQGLVEEIVDFGDAQLFEGATNYTCILVLSRRGATELVYRRVDRGEAALRNALASLDAVPAERFPLRELGDDPWVLATGDEARLLRSLRGGAEPLGEVTSGIFTGLQTSADPIYVLEDRGGRGPRRRVYSPASDRELELESNLLQPLASGSDVDRYAFHRLRHLLLFPYRRDGAAMRLLTTEELEALPLTAAYLREHEATLRGRERGRMDHNGWYAFGRTQSLGAHDQPKLGVAATVRRLEVAADHEGAVYFHNVRVNGILVNPEGPSIWTLLTLLNSRPLDWVFRRGSVDHANGYFAANKQFIAPLPIRQPEVAGPIEALGRRLHDLARAATTEREGFLDWLEDSLGAHVRRLPGATSLARYEYLELSQLLAILRRSRALFVQDPEARVFREHLASEHGASRDRLLEQRSSLSAAESEADEAVADLYELSTTERALIDRDYG